MSVIIDNNLILSESLAQPLTHARILYRTIWRRSDSTITASSEQDLFPAGAAAQELTWSYWRPAEMPATWEVSTGALVTINACGIAAHTFGTNSTTVEVQYHDGTDWQTIEDFAPATDDPILFLFEEQEATRFRVRLTGADEPAVGVIFFGQTLDMQRPIYGGHSPLPLSRNTVRETNKSDRGQWLGASLVRKGVATDYSWENLTADWYRENFDPFVTYATQSRSTFFIAWRPVKFPKEVGYCWVTQDDIVPSNMGTRDLMDVSISVDGQLQYQAPDAEDFA